LVQEITSNIVFESVDYGPVTTPDGSIIQIVTLISGFNAVTNDIPGVPGRLIETDVEARLSYLKRIAMRSTNMLESIKARLYNNVQGVVSVACFENDTDFTDADGRLPHSIEVVVDGGDSGEIARQIMETKVNGINTNGTEVAEVVDNDGNFHTIRFNRPEILYVWLQVTVNRDERQTLPGNYADLIRVSVMAEAAGLEVGNSVLIQRFISSVYRAVTGIDFVTISAFASSAQDDTPVYTEANVTVGPRQRALLDAARIAVVLSA
jgi:hypothetical protein